MDMFEKASRVKLRFPSPVGPLMVEDLWDLPLSAARAARPSLDGVARAVHAELRILDEGSFVDDGPDPRRAALDLMMEVVKHVISRKKAWAAAEKAAETAARRKKLIEALGRVQDRELEGMTADQLREEINRLSSDDSQASGYPD